LQSCFTSHFGVGKSAQSGKSKVQNCQEIKKVSNKRKREHVTPLILKETKIVKDVVFWNPIKARVEVSKINFFYIRKYILKISILDTQGLVKSVDNLWKKLS